VKIKIRVSFLPQHACERTRALSILTYMDTSRNDPPTPRIRFVVESALKSAKDRFDYSSDMFPELCKATTNILYNKLGRNGSTLLLAPPEAWHEAGLPQEVYLAVHDFCYLNNPGRFVLPEAPYHNMPRKGHSPEMKEQINRTFVAVKKQQAEQRKGKGPATKGSTGPSKGESVHNYDSNVDKLLAKGVGKGDGKGKGKGKGEKGAYYKGKGKDKGATAAAVAGGPPHKGMSEAEGRPNGEGIHAHKQGSTAIVGENTDTNGNTTSTFSGMCGDMETPVTKMRNSILFPNAPKKTTTTTTTLNSNAGHTATAHFTTPAPQPPAQPPTRSILDSSNYKGSSGGHPSSNPFMLPPAAPAPAPIPTPASTKKEVPPSEIKFCTASSLLGNEPGGSKRPRRRDSDEGRRGNGDAGSDDEDGAPKNMGGGATHHPSSSSTGGTNNKKSKKEDEGEEMEKKILKDILSERPKVSFQDIVGLDGPKESLRQMIILPLLNPGIYTGLREPPRGLLMFGPGGNGKTFIAKAVASECVDVTFFNLSAASLTSKWVGESEKLMRALFKVARARAPSLIFIDEIDSILCKRGDSDNEGSRRLKTEFLVQFDGVVSSGGSGADGCNVIVLAATNRPWDLDEAALRRFTERFYVPLPTKEARLRLLTKLLDRENKCLTEEDLEQLVTQMEGFAAFEVQGACRRAAQQQMRELSFDVARSINEGDLRPLSMSDFEKALKVIRAANSKSAIEEHEKWNAEYGSAE